MSGRIPSSGSDAQLCRKCGARFGTKSGIPSMGIRGMDDIFHSQHYATRAQSALALQASHTRGGIPSGLRVVIGAAQSRSTGLLLSSLIRQIAHSNRDSLRTASSSVEF